MSEIPYLILCATLYFCCWYFTAGFPVDARVSGHIYFQMICMSTSPSPPSHSPYNPITKRRAPHAVYEFLYTSIGQAIAAYAPNEYFAAISNPLLLGCGLVSFCGVVVPYTAMPAFWKYWLYYLDPFRYLVGGLLGTLLWEVEVKCKPDELTSFSPPTGQTCGEYMADFLASNAGYVENANSTTSCQYCPYATGGEYAQVFNLNEKYYAWRDVSGLTNTCRLKYHVVTGFINSGCAQTGITALFCISSYTLVIVMMKLRSKKTKSARSD